VQHDESYYRVLSLEDEIKREELELFALEQFKQDREAEVSSRLNRFSASLSRVTNESRLCSSLLSSLPRLDPNLDQQPEKFPLSSLALNLELLRIQAETRKNP